MLKIHSTLPLTTAQLAEIKDRMHSRCNMIEYAGFPRPHINSIIAYVKRHLEINKLSEIPQQRFQETIQLIQTYSS